MRLLTKCCFKIPLKFGCVMILSAYWVRNWTSKILSATYIILLIQYFTDHTLPISILLGVILIISLACSVLGLYGLFKKRNAYYVIPEIVIDAIDCILHLINLVYRLFRDDLVIPRYTLFGTSKTVMEADQSDTSFKRKIVNLFDERYPLPNMFAFFDLCVRVYFLMVFISYVLEYRNRSLKKHVRKTAKKANKIKSPAKSVTSSTPKSPASSTRKSPASSTPKLFK